MIREFSTVRYKPDGRLGFVCDFDEDVIGNPDDPSCVRTVEVFDAGKPYDECERIDCFLVDIDEVVEADGSDRECVCSDFDYIEIGNHWTEDTPPERYYTIWIIREDDVVSAWLRRGFFGNFERLITLSASKTAFLRQAIEQSGIQSWGRSYKNNDWCIGSNAWSITLIRDTRKVTTSGDDAYHHDLKTLCEDLRSIGLPFTFWEEHGLVYRPLRVKERRRILKANDQDDA